MEGGAGVLESKKKRDHQVRTIRKKREELSSYKNEIKSTRPDDTSSIPSSLLGWKSGEMSRGRRPPLEGRKFRFQLRERVSRVSLQKRASSSIRFVHDPLIATIGNCSSRVSSSRQIQNLSQHGQRRNSLGRMAPLLCSEMACFDPAVPSIKRVVTTRSITLDDIRIERNGVFRIFLEIEQANERVCSLWMKINKNNIKFFRLNEYQ